MVDLAIASNFVRELTEEQFAESRRKQRARAAAAAHTEGRARVQAPGEDRARSLGPSGIAATALRRVLSRLVHVRG
jgi:hypothetical protein